MPGLKTRKRIKKENTAPVMMSVEPSIFRPHAHSDSSSGRQAQPRRMENPALQLKRARSARSFSDIALQRLSSHPSVRQGTSHGTIQKDDEPNGTATTTPPSSSTTSQDQNDSASIPQGEVDKIVDDHTSHLPTADELTLDVGRVKQDANQLRKQKSKLTRDHPAMNAMLDESILENAQQDGGTPDFGGGTADSKASRGRVAAMVDENDAVSHNRHVAGRHDNAKINTENLARYVAQQGAVEQDIERATESDRRAQIGQISSMVAPTVAGQTAIRIAHQSAQMGGRITAIVQSFVATFDALLNARALHRARIQAAELKTISASLKEAGHNPKLVEAVEFAIRKKHGKMIARAISLANNLLTLGTATAVIAGAGLVALLSNPAGWGALTVLAAIGLVITSAVTLYYIGKWAWKKWKGTLGVLRRQMATTIFEKLRQQDPAAQQVVKVLMGDETGAVMAETAQITETGALKKLQRAKAELLDGNGDQSLSANDRIREVKKINDSIETIKANRLKKAEQVAPLLKALYGQNSYDLQIEVLTIKRDRFLNKLQRDTTNASFQRGSKRNRLVRKVDALDKQIQALEAKKTVDLRNYRWKRRPKMDRNAIKQIDRKLRNW